MFIHTKLKGEWNNGMQPVPVDHFAQMIRTPTVIGPCLSISNIPL